MIADFGLSRVMEEEKFHLLTEICGTPGVIHCPFPLVCVDSNMFITVHGSRNFQKKYVYPSAIVAAYLA